MRTVRVGHGHLTLYHVPTRWAIIVGVTLPERRNASMPLPAPVEALWNDLQSVRTRLLREVEGLSQAQADWCTSDQDWSVGEIVHHLTLAEIGTGKVTSRVLRDAGETVKPFPADLKAFAPLSTPAGGRAEAPQGVWPERGKPFPGLVAEMKAARERSRQSIERL